MLTRQELIYYVTDLNCASLIYKEVVCFLKEAIEWLLGNRLYYGLSLELTTLTTKREVNEAKRLYHHYHYYY
jgi:hypothetical protein